MKWTAQLFSVLFLLVSNVLFAQVSFTAQVSRNSIGINQRVEVSFTINEDGDNFSPPDFKDFSVVSGPMHSVSQSWVNGKTSFRKSYSYFLAPSKKGTLTVGAASIEYKGTIYRTKPITIIVGDAVKEEPRQSQGYGGYGRQPQQERINPENIGQGIHLVAEVSKTNPYLNEPVSVVYKLYVSHQAGFKSLNVVASPKYTNFWNHTVQVKDMEVKLGKFQGKEYRYVVLQNTVLLPQKEGKLTIDPLELELLVETPTGRYDFFGYPEMTVSKKIYSTGTKVVNVKPLPLENQPDNFTGAVGNYTFDVKANKTTVKANETIELTVTANGKGNLQLFTLPKPLAPAALELYDPELSEKVSNNIASGMEGSKSEKYVIVPQYKGQYTIKPMSFSYFDTASKTYKTITSQEIVIDVTEGPELPQNTPKKEDLSNADVFQEIVTTTTFEQKKADDFFDSKMFYALLIAPLALIPFLILGYRRQASKRNDLTGNRIRNNNKLAKKYLGEAKRKLGDKNGFYEALERCLHNFLKAKLSIETSEMSNENIRELLQQRKIQEENIQQFIDIKSTCEMARYSQFDITSMQNDFAKALEVITNLEKQFKS